MRVLQIQNLKKRAGIGFPTPYTLRGTLFGQLGKGDWRPKDDATVEYFKITYLPTSALNRFWRRS